MCRVLAYLGQPTSVDDLLYGPDSALVRQTLDPRMLHMLNLAGFGMMAWDPDSHGADLPFAYRSTSLPIFDRNLKGLARKLRTTALLAHVRGVAYHERVTVGEQNLHPFHYDGARLALAHNGDLARFGEMRFGLAEHVRPEIATRIRGNTDSEWIYALLLSQLDDPGRYHTSGEIGAAIRRTLSIIRAVRERFAIATSSSVNLFIGDGRSLAVVRFTYDFGCYATGDPAQVHEANLAFLSLWHTTGREYGHHDGEWKMIGGRDSTRSVIVASEPLSRDTATWREVDEYSLLTVTPDGDGGHKIESVELDV